jgi:uncharacterized protein YndB with AHSA1/START domain
MPSVVRTIEIPAPPSAVWRWFATPDGLRRWLAPTLEIDLRVGGRYRMLGGDDETWISGTVLELVPEGRLVLSWLEEERSGPSRTARRQAHADSRRHRGSLVHDGFAGIGIDNWTATVEGYERGADRHHVLADLVSLAVGSA